MHWTEVWHGKGFGPAALRTALSPLSWLYQAGWQTYLGVYRLGLKRPAEPHCPVVCVGNLVVGGSGKSPLTLHVARVLQSMGREVVLSCNGYGSPASVGAQLAPEGELDPREWGDEPAMFRWLAPELPIVVGRRRVLAAEIVHERLPEAVMLMDDGFQHLPLKKHVTIVVDRGGANRRCLPAGPYREPWSNRSRADLVLPGDGFEMRAGISELGSRNWGDGGAFRDGGISELEGQTGSNPKSEIRDPASAQPKSDIQNSKSPDPRSEFRDPSSQIQVLCALGNPQSFLQSLRDKGLRIHNAKTLPDHDPLNAGNLFEGLDPRLPVALTAKDWVKLRLRSDLAGWDIRVAMQEVTVEPQEEFRAWLAQALDGAEKKPATR